MRLPWRAEDDSLSVGRRLKRAFGLLIGLIVLVSGAAVVGTLYEVRVIDALSSHVLPTREANLHVHIELANASRQIREYLLTGDPAQVARFRRSRNTYQVALADARTQAAPDAQQYLTTQQQEITGYLRIADLQEAAVPRSLAAARLTAAADAPYGRFESANSALDDLLSNQADQLHDRISLIISTMTVAAGALFLLAVASALIATVRATGAITGPLADVEAVLGRLAQGEHATRAEERGPAEIRAVARSVNALADENDRLRQEENERVRLAAAARHAGIGIRSASDVDGVLDEAATGIGSALRADQILILMAEEDGPTVPVVRAWSAERGTRPESEVRGLPRLPAEEVRAYVSKGKSPHFDDISGYLAGARPPSGAPGSFGGTGLPAQIRAALVALGATAVLAVPFVAGKEALGAVVLIRCRPGDHWLPREIEAVEPIVAGLGRALQQSRAFRQETRLVGKLRALDKAKNDFLSTVSHELRTPLTSIVGYVELLANDSGPLSETQQHMLDVVDRNATRLRSLIEDLLTLSRIEAGNFTSEMGPVDLAQLVNSAMEAIRPAASAGAIELEQRCPARPLLILGDSDQLDRVLMNLLSNAVKFTPGGGRITVLASRQDGEAVLSVSDTGIGIPASDRGQLFSRFFRASNATDRAIPGTGLGLAIVRGIVTNHQGRLEVDSEEDRGTTITSHFPLLAEEPSGDA
ncbi:GAF domain-containing protein [Streptomyces sp. 846.5]|nr:ATP-binding protein [Streptomyces sp. 846.5]TDT94124.1 GAF domain-containing protein [Streptomyces sp. 846.5]